LILPFHGSNPKALYEAYQMEKPELVIDFSVNINPLGSLPSLQTKWKDWQRLIYDYPDPEGSDLKKLIATKENLHKNNVLLGNGGAELIAVLANYFSKKRVGIVQPAFGEYERMAKAYECQLVHIVLPEEKWTDLSPVFEKLPFLDAIFLTNPNNPTGITYDEKQLHRLKEQCKKHRCYLIIDEAFYDFTEGFTTSATNITTNEFVIILRSLTKMYAIAGLRLGYLLADHHLVQQLEKRLPYWNVNALALEVGKLCAKDDAYAHSTSSYIKKERERIFRRLKRLGYKFSKSEVNYYLLRHPKLKSQNPLIIYLLKHGLVSRHTENFRGLNGNWIRLAIKTKKENERLLQYLHSFTKLF